MVRSDLGTIVALKHCTTSAIEAAKLGAPSVAASCPGTVAMNLAKEALLAVLIAAWIVGLVHQFGSWSMTAVYVAISLVMVAVMFGGELVPKFALRRIRRR